MSDSAEISEVKGFDAYPVRLGDLMRGERATLGKSLLDVQRDLRVRAAYIAAIENCDPSVFQTPGFIAGYVRSYARYLGLDPEATFRQFCDEAGFDGVHPDIGQIRTNRQDPPATPIRTLAGGDENPPIRFPQFGTLPTGDGVLQQVSISGLGSILVLLALILGLGYGAWAVLQSIQRVEIAPPSEEFGPVALADPLPETALENLYRPKELEVPVMVPRDGPIAALDPDSIGALIEGNGGRNARATAQQLAETTPQVTAPAAPEVAVVALRPAWVRLTRGDGTVLFERILDGGESFVLPKGAADISLRAGNSGSVFLSLDGVPYGPVGKDTSVVKQVSLAPEAVIAGFDRVEEDSMLATLASPRVVTLNDLPPAQ